MCSVHDIFAKHTYWASHPFAGRHASYEMYFELKVTVLYMGAHLDLKSIDALHTIYTLAP